MHTIPDKCNKPAGYEFNSQSAGFKLLKAIFYFYISFNLSIISLIASSVPVLPKSIYIS